MTTEMTDGHPESVESLLAEWENDVRRAGDRFNKGKIVCLAGLAGIVVVWLSAWLGNALGWWHRLPQAWNFALQITQLLLMFVPVTGALWATRGQNRRLRKLVNVDDLRVVGPLCEALMTMSDLRKEDMDRAILVALERLLPRMKASDTELLIPRQRKYLYRMLVRNLPVDFRQQALFRIIVLQALEQIGDGEALSYVEALANGDAETRYQVAVQDAAIACLPILKARAAQEKVGKNLLRASDAPDIDNLLIPVTSQLQAPKEQLLRATTVRTP